MMPLVANATQMLLFVTPVLYLGFDGLARRFSRGRGRPEVEGASPAE